jgi:hypothetical protein
LPTAITLLLRAVEVDSLGALVHVLSDATALAPTIVKNATSTNVLPLTHLSPALI